MPIAFSVLFPEEEHHDQTISRRRFLKYAGLSQAVRSSAWQAVPRPLRRQPPPRPACGNGGARTAARPRRAEDPAHSSLRDMQNIDPAFRISNNDETIIDCVFSKLVAYRPATTS